MDAHDITPDPPPMMDCVLVLVGWWMLQWMGVCVCF